MRWLAALALLCLSPGAAEAGAWTEQAGHWQIISALWGSEASRAFDGKGDASLDTAFRKILAQTSTEYGWNNRLTLIFNTETAYADVRQTGLPPQQGVNNAFEGGARYRITDRFGVLSVQASYRTAGAFNFAVSANSRQAGEAEEIRLLYGRSFKLWRRDGFWDVEAGERFLSAPRPDETPVDLTAGLWLNRNNMMMLQSFNLISGSAEAPYSYYRSHKIELSYVRRLSKRYLVQAGAFFSPSGQNALVEQGVSVALWTQF